MSELTRDLEGAQDGPKRRPEPARLAQGGTQDMSEEDMSTFASKILLATDGSPEAERAARMAVTMSNGLGSELHVVRVGGVPSAYYGYSEAEMFGREFQIVRARAEEYVRESLDEEAEKVRAMGGEVAGSHAGAGSADAEIVRLAEELGAGLVILGSRRFGPLRRAVMGSVSSSVVRHAHCSVLVVRGDRREEDRLPGRILLAFDGSKEAYAATRAAVEISNATGSELHIVYGLDTEPWLSYPGPVMPDSREENLGDLEESKRKARAWVDQQAECIEAEGAKVEEVHLAFGKPDEVIVKRGEELEVGLIVTGSRGLGGVRRALMGSVSDSVVRHARCPVLVVRGGDHRQRAVERGLASEAEPEPTSMDPASGDTTRRNEGWMSRCSFGLGYRWRKTGASPKVHEQIDGRLTARRERAKRGGSPW